ncbi:MAG: ABC transporter substrate-binding protein [bacterium]|nr:ABC transporter substrate-binding protein [bacterium]
MHKIQKLLFAVVIVMIVGVLWYFVAQNNKERSIKIGVIGHFSGAYAEYGVPMKKAIELAVDEINQDGGINKQKVKLVFEDDSSDANSAATAINKLIFVDGVNYILSAQGSGITAAVTPIANNNNRIMIITLGSAPELTKVGGYIFRSIPSDTYQAVKMVDLINNNLGSQKIAGLYINDSYGVGIKDIINANSRTANVDSEIFESQATDFRTQLLKIKESKADTLVIVAHTEYPLILKQIKELNLNVKIIASETFKDDTLLSQSGSTAEGVMVTFMAGQKDYVNFSNNYQTKFNEKSSAYGMYAYDGFIALSKAIKDGGISVEGVRNSLSQVQFNGASGMVGFNADRDRIGSEYMVYIVQDGKFVPYQQ